MLISRRMIPLCVAVAIGSSSLPRTATADAAADKALAAQLFNDARALMKKNNYDAACPKFQRAHELDDSADGIVWNLGLCFEGWGKPATAWSYFNDAHLRAIKASNKERERATKEKMDAVALLISKVTIHVEPVAQVDGLVVAIDGTPLTPAEWGTSLNRDPGNHHVTAEAPGHEKWSADFELGKSADSKTIDIPLLKLSQAIDKPAVTSNSVKAPTTSYPLPDASRSHAGQIIAFTAAGVFLGGSIVARVVMGHEKDTYFSTCAETRTFGCDNPDGRSSVRRWETISFVSGGLALAAIGIGVAFALAGPSTSDKKSALLVSPSVGATNGLSIAGSF